MVLPQPMPIRVDGKTSDMPKTASAIATRQAPDKQSKRTYWERT